MASRVTRTERRKYDIVSFRWNTEGKGTQALGLNERVT